MNQFSAGDGAIAQGAKAVSDSRGALTNELNALRGKLEAVPAGWQGQGAAAFAALMSRWNEDANKIISALNEFEQNLISSSSSYIAADEAQSASISNYQGRLG